MQVIVDTSVLIAVLTSEAERGALVRTTAGVNLVAPTSVHWEIGNACSALLKRRRADLSQVQLMLKAYAAIPIRFVDVDLGTALEIAARQRLYAYDAYLIACALAQRAPLLTLDRDLARAAEASGVRLQEVSE